MDELEFRQRIEADPHNLDEEALAAARENPEFQGILEQCLEFDSQLQAVLGSEAAPAALKDRLLGLPDQASTEAASSEEINDDFKNPLSQYLAMAASFILAVGAGFYLTLDSGPTIAEEAMGNQVIAHLYHENAQMEAINAGTLDRNFAIAAINSVMANSGSQFVSESFLTDMPVRYANPCPISETFNSAHLILQSSQGALNVITIDSSPVRQEFLIEDERFTGIVIPMRGGNLILVGEKNQNIEDYRSVLENEVEWVI